MNAFEQGFLSKLAAFVRNNPKAKPSKPKAPANSKSKLDALVRRTMKAAKPKPKAAKTKSPETNIASISKYISKSLPSKQQPKKKYTSMYQDNKKKVDIVNKTRAAAAKYRPSWIKRKLYGIPESARLGSKATNIGPTKAPPTQAAKRKARHISLMKGGPLRAKLTNAQALAMKKRLNKADKDARDAKRDSAYKRGTPMSKMEQVDPKYAR